MFIDKMKIKKWTQLLIVALFSTLALTMTGCKGNIDKDALESYKVGHDSVFDDEDESNSGNNSDYNKDNTESLTTDGQQNDVSTEDVSGETETSDKETTTEAPTTTQPTTTQPTTTQPTTTQPTTTQPVPNTPATLKMSYPTASGIAVEATADGFAVDYSNASSGYVMAKGSGSGNTICIQVYKDAIGGSKDYSQQCITTDNGNYITLPLTNGSGKYFVRVLQKASDGKYYTKCTAEINTTISNETSPYLYPNYTVNFNAGSVAVNTALQVCAGCDTDADKVAAVKQYVMKVLEYDYSKADQVQAGTLKGYVPNVDSVLASGKGICYDYSALFAAMLRCQGIPVRLVKGYVPEGYHAWNEAYYSGSWHRIDCTYEDSSGSQASSYENKSYH